MIVVDTNVVAYLAMPSPHTAAAERLLLREPDWIVPRLWRSEMRNVLAVYLRKSLITLEEAVRVQSELEDFFRGREYDLGSLDVLALLDECTCSAYACEFVVLARSIGITLITMDRKLVDAFPESTALLTDFARGG